MSQVEPQVAQQLQQRISEIESGTDLKRVAIISRAGMKIATATSAQMDADAETGSSAALIELSDKLSNAVNHGELREIIVKAREGFVILQHVNPEFMVFGGISNPLRVGFYLEYLRNEAHKFAYILAGNKVTDDLMKEIEAQKDRTRKADQQKIENITEGFEMDKSDDDDMKAMEGVLDFLNDWSDEGEEQSAQSAPSADNIVGIDQDMTFGFGDLDENIAPTSISQDEIQKARGMVPGTESAEQSAVESTTAGAEEDSMNEALAALDAIASDVQPENAESTATESAQPSTPQPEEAISEEDAMADALNALEGFSGRSTASNDVAQGQSGEVTEDEEGLPDDILATLDEIAEGSSASSKAKEIQKEQETQEEKETPYGIKVYEGEVPPVPLEDYVSFEVGSLTQEEQEAQKQAQDISMESQTQQEFEQSEPIQAQEMPQAEPDFAAADEFSSDLPIGEDGEPDFDAMVASEYVDPDLELEEDALVDALNELEKEKKK